MKKKSKEPDNLSKIPFKIIIIEDDEGLNRVIQRMISRAGYQYEWALTGKEALDKITGSYNEILLVGYKLPDMNARQLIERLAGKFDRVPAFVIITGFGDVHQVVEMMKLGARDFIIKESDFIDSLSGKLDQIISNVEKDRRLKIAEAKLERSNIRYHDLFSKMINGFAIHEVIQNEKGDVTDYITLEVNPAYEELLNIEKKLILGKRISEILSKEEAEKWLKIFGSVAISGKPIRYEMYSEHFERYFEGIAFSPEKGKFSVTFSDITKRKRAEEEIKSINHQLTASEQQLKASNKQLVENEQQIRAANLQLIKNESELRKRKEAAESYLNIAAEIILELNTKGEIILLNDSGYKLLEYEKGELEGKDWIKTCLAQETRVEVYKYFREIIFGRVQEMSSYESDIVTKTGEYKTILWHNTILRDEYGEIYGILSSGEDITARKEAEQEIQKNNLFLNTVINNSPIPKWITDTEGTIIKANKSLLKHLNVSEEDVVGKYNLLNDRNLVEQNLMLKIQEVFQNKKTVRFTMRWFGNRSGFLSFSGANNPWIDISISPILDSEGNLTNVMGQWIDITNQKEAEIALRESENKFRKISENSPDAIFITDTSGNYVYVNREATKLLGYSKKELLQMNVIDVVESFKRHNNINEYSKLLSGKKHSFDTILIHNNGTKIPVELNSILLENDQVYASCRDISLRKKQEEQFIQAKIKAEESEKVFHDLFNNLNSGVAVFEVVGDGEDFIFKYFNDGAERIDLQSRDELIGKSFFEVRPGLKEFGLIDTFRKVFKTNQPQHHPVTLYKDNVREGHYENYVFLLPSGELVAVFDDITERIKFENELKLAKEKAEESEKKLIESQIMARLGDWELDFETRIFTFTDNFYKIYRTNAKEVGGYQMTARRYAELFVHPDDAYLIEDATSKVIVSDVPNYPDLVEHKMKYYDGSTGYVAVRFFLKKDSKGKIIRAYGVSQDITERKNAEIELIKAKENAEEADKLKSAFLANMSHEIRTPMNGILGFTSLLQEPGLTGEDQQKYIQVIQKSGERLLNTVNDIVEVSKIETGQIKIDLGKINVSEHLRTLLDFFILEAKKKGLELIVENKFFEAESSIITDKNKLSSVISNLIKNAIKFTEKGSIRIGCRKKGRLLEFYISDTGIGIPENRREAIFNRFEQADIKDSRVYEGSGLGLSIAKSYVEMLGGKIWVETELNQGSTFYFTINRNKIQTEDGNPEEIKSYGKREKAELKVLVAEDDEVSKMHLRVILKDVAREILIANTGIEAVNIVKENPDIDIVLMDVKMPEMNGLEATQKIREFNEQVVVIAQTAFALEGDRQKAIDSGCNDYISKPFVKRELAALIEKYV